MSSLCNFPKKFMNCPYNFVIIGVCGYLPCPAMPIPRLFQLKNN